MEANSPQKFLKVTKKAETRKRFKSVVLSTMQGQAKCRTRGNFIGQSLWIYFKSLLMP